MHQRIAFILSCFSILSASIAGVGQDASLPRDMVLDNSQIRVRRIKKEPQQRTPLHYVPPLLVVYLNPAHDKLLLPDGSTKQESYAAGDFRWWDGGERGSENVGDHAFEFLTILVKDSTQPSQSTLSISELQTKNPDMARFMVFDNDKLRVFRVTK